ncbi:hypothetical protein AWC38_SpisGene628 [Stylophora pistillata]|uniref:Uncharacterized protein n=1 Tax=Stylophora pistillata TaxID=50429 RepID=A0A2B4SUP2_STYPI|nr:hypothetical protein AWC38_SpisGene628 [Stylophora pistillata]
MKHVFGVNITHIHMINVQQRMPHATSARSRHFEEVCLQKKGHGPKDLNHNAIHATSIYHDIGKVDTGAMVSCMPMSMLSQVGLSKDDIKVNNAVIQGESGANLQNYATMDVNVTCNSTTAQKTFYITKCKCAFILGLEFCKSFKQALIALICIQQSISIDPDNIAAVHITDESEVHYNKLCSKWREYLPLGRKTRVYLKDLNQIFPDTFDVSIAQIMKIEPTQLVTLQSQISL